MDSLFKDYKIKMAIEQIAVRTEHHDPQTVVDSFYDCNIISHYANVNHQVIQGRRGTGKTHILRVLQVKMETETQHCIYFVCKGIGSAQEISDSNLPEKHRAIQLMRDFLLNIYNDLCEYYREVLNYGDSNKLSKDIRALLSILYSECYSVGKIEEKFEQTQNRRTNVSKHRQHAFKISLLPLTSDLERTDNNDLDDENAKERKVSGVSFLKVVYPNIKHCLAELAAITGKRFVILIDEWANLPWELQPHFSEFLHQCFFSNDCFTLKIAAVKERSRYCIRQNSTIYGLELGSDLKADFDLDQIYALDNNPRKIFSDLFGILWTHLKAKKVLQGIDVSAFLAGLCVDFKTASLLVRASEGNPRDFISILHQCIIQSDGMGNSTGKIRCDTVYAAANSWYMLDKYAALTPEQCKLLDELTLFVVHEHDNRAFMIAEEHLHSKLIAGLIDARVLHPLKIRRFFPNLSNQPLAILVLDFGTYSPELEIGKEIHFYASNTDDVIEASIFGEYEISRYDDGLYPLDALRKFRICYWDPEYLNYPLS